MPHPLSTLLIMAAMMIVASGCASSSTGISASKIAEVEAEIEEAYARMESASERLDDASVADLLSDHPDMTFANVGWLFGPKRQLVDELLPAWAGSGLQSQQIDRESSKITVFSTDLAIQSVAVRFTSTAADGTVSPVQWAVQTYVWNREGGAWKIFQVHQSFRGGDG